MNSNLVFDSTQKRILLLSFIRSGRNKLTAGGAGGRLAAESLANLLAVHLIRLRHQVVSRPRRRSLLITGAADLPPLPLPRLTTA